ncbi:hypothetical protein Q5P01_002215 [Channa striata]|uniref:Ependymin n=1 Tax=Channa striata TaxID=64152 RepID=A0AA88T4L9_CHASR|nr:hypothetical protein Q5P01_002215 [Channa striata]
MRVLTVFVCLTAGCFAQKPQPCTSPPLLTGSLSLGSADEKLGAYAKFNYDALRERIRLSEFRSYKNKTFQFDVLLLYKEGVMYEIDKTNQACTKKPLSVDFNPLAIPTNASLLGPAMLGSSSGPGNGLLVNTWVGKLQIKKEMAKYVTAVTGIECIPVTTLFHTNTHGWVVTNFFNNVLGITDPELLIPPPFCEDAQLEEEDERDAANFFSLF